jgi:hypothetical protein
MNDKSGSLGDQLLYYNSELETRKHIQRVNELLILAAQNLLNRAIVHDQSKLEPFEKPYFDKLTPQLAGCTYGSEKYFQFLEELKPALKHHYKMNSHHPEHYVNGINGMDLFDLVEIVF